MRVRLGRIVADQGPLEDDGVVKIIVVWRFNVKLVGKRVGESVTEVQETRRGDEIGEAGCCGNAERPLRLGIRLRRARDVPEARQGGAWGERRKANDVLQTGPD